MLHVKLVIMVKINQEKLQPTSANLTFVSPKTQIKNKSI